MGKKDYSNYTKEELIKEVELLKKSKNYGLVWDEKKTEENFDYYINWEGIKNKEVFKGVETKFPVVKEIKNNEVITNKNVNYNLLIEGDNYHSLAVLNFTHKASVDFIYIDPPYNTGARDWKYNNDFVESDDPYRHSKWLSFMSKRLKLAKEILKMDGIICVTIDDYEAPRLWMLLDEIFGEKNHLGTAVIRSNPKGRKTKRKISLTHEYAIFYGRTNQAKIKNLPINPEDKTHNYKKDENGGWYLPTNLRKQGVDSLAKKKDGTLSNRFYPIYFDEKTGTISTSVKKGKEIFPIDLDGNKRIW